MTVAIVDTGQPVAVFDRAEQRPRWVAERFDELDAPLLVCEPVLAEARHLLARYPKAQDAVLELIHKGALSVAFRIDEHIGTYDSYLVALSFAVACLASYTALTSAAGSERRRAGQDARGSRRPRSRWAAASGRCISSQCLRSGCRCRSAMISV